MLNQIRNFAALVEAFGLLDATRLRLAVAHDRKRRSLTAVQ